MVKIGLEDLMIDFKDQFFISDSQYLNTIFKLLFEREFLRMVKTLMTNL